MNCNKTNCMSCKFGGQSDGCHFDEESYNQALDEVVKKLAESEDTILSDKQYYALMELKEQK